MWGGIKITTKQQSGEMFQTVNFVQFKTKFQRVNFSQCFLFMDSILRKLSTRKVQVQSKDGGEGDIEYQEYLISTTRDRQKAHFVCTFQRVCGDVKEPTKKMLTVSGKNTRCQLVYKCYGMFASNLRQRKKRRSNTHDVLLQPMPSIFSAIFTRLPFEYGWNTFLRSSSFLIGKNNIRHELYIRVLYE